MSVPLARGRNVKWLQTLVLTCPIAKNTSFPSFLTSSRDCGVHCPVFLRMCRVFPVPCGACGVLTGAPGGAGSGVGTGQAFPCDTGIREQTQHPRCARVCATCRCRPGSVSCLQARGLGALTLEPLGLLPWEMTRWQEVTPPLASEAPVMPAGLAGALALVSGSVPEEADRPASVPSAVCACRPSAVAVPPTRWTWLDIS